MFIRMNGFCAIEFSIKEDTFDTNLNRSLIFFFGVVSIYENKLRWNIWKSYKYYVTLTKKKTQKDFIFQYLLDFDLFKLITMKILTMWVIASNAIESINVFDGLVFFKDQTIFTAQKFKIKILKIFVKIFLYLFFLCVRCWFVYWESVHCQGMWWLFRAKEVAYVN